MRSDLLDSLPPTISSEKGLLMTTLSLDRTIYTFVVDDLERVTIRTRLFNGIFPGPTLRMKAGDRLRVTFENRLDRQYSSTSSDNSDISGEISEQEHPSFLQNHLSAPDESNLHFHGLHLSGELPSDDSTYVVPQGTSYTYVTKVPKDHMPGTHWLHPHRHGATSLQTGGGAAGAIIVEDPPGSLPPVVEEALDVVFLVQQMNIDQSESVAEESLDTWFAASIKESFRSNSSKSSDTSDSLSTISQREFVLVNGQVQPTIRVEGGRWIRLRIIWAAWLKGKLNLQVPDCEMVLLAKDGIYIDDFPRTIDVAPIVPGGRADIMVRCMDCSTAATGNCPIFGTGETIASIETTGATTSEAETEEIALAPWNPIHPKYLSDLRSVPASPGCTCNVTLNKNAINGYFYDEKQMFFQSYLGAVVERRLVAGKHPYHQHVYPYQLIEGNFDEKDDSNYNRIGDWHDSVQGEGIIRFQPQDYTGKVIIHCHRLLHEDRGMMAIEYVHPKSQKSTCSCVPEEFSSSSLTRQAGMSSIPSFSMIGVALVMAIVTLSALVATFLHRQRRKASPPIGSKVPSYGTLEMSIDSEGELA